MAWKLPPPTPKKELPSPMKITQLETIQLAEYPNILFVQLHTDDGLVGLGETFFGAPEVSAYLHDSAAHLLLGQDPSAIDALRVKLKGYVGMHGTAGELASNLLEQGISGMKMWPFDAYAYASGGTNITAAELDRALEPFRQVRRAVGERMELMVELHGLWNLPTALKIARAFESEGLRPYWIEDPLRPDDIASLARFAQATQIPTTASEQLGGRKAFRELLEARAASVVMLDLGWCGGISEGKAIATMAEA